MRFIAGVFLCSAILLGLEVLTIGVVAPWTLGMPMPNFLDIVRGLMP